MAVVVPPGTRGGGTIPTRPVVPPRTTDGEPTLGPILEFTGEVLTAGLEHGQKTGLAPPSGPTQQTRPVTTLAGSSNATKPNAAAIQAADLGAVKATPQPSQPLKAWLSKVKQARDATLKEWDAVRVAKAPVIPSFNPGVSTEKDTANCGGCGTVCTHAGKFLDTEWCLQGYSQIAVAVARKASPSSCQCLTYTGYPKATLKPGGVKPQPKVITPKVLGVS